jgi:hypothetical protein
VIVTVSGTAAIVKAAPSLDDAPPATAPPQPIGSATTPVAPPASTIFDGEGDAREGLDPIPSRGRYLDYGMAFHSEAVLSSGRLCPKDAKENCVLGGGGGISFGAAYRTSAYSVGAVYEVTFHDSSNIYQRGVLQQLRGEWRVRPSFAVVPDTIVGFLGLGGGLATYGDNWAIDTYGPSAHGSIGGEIELGIKVALVVAISYRAFYLKSFEDPSRQPRPAGIAHMLGLQLGLELHDPL